jgi:hypothetical protein
MNKTVIILGMHRSGTSLLANWMHHCNLKLGDEYYKGLIGNKEGHYEDIDFLNLHEEILLANNLDPSGLKSWEIPRRIDEYYIDKIKALIQKKNRLYSHWGWKEPRTCLFLDHYRRILPEAYYLILLREPALVVDSLIRRDLIVLKEKFRKTNKVRYKTFKMFYWYYKNEIAKKSEEIYLKAWIAYNENIVDHLNYILRKKSLIFSFDNIQSNQNIVFNFLENAGFPIIRKDFKCIFKPNMIKTRKLKLKHTPFSLIEKADTIYTSLLNKKNF